MDIQSIHALSRFSSEKMQKVNVFKTSHFYLDLYCLEPGQAQKVHEHKNSSKFYMVLEGEPELNIDGESECLKPGQAVAAPAGSPHGVSNPTDERAVLLVSMSPPPEHA